MVLGGGDNAQLDQAMIALGYIGGAALSLCLVPQLIAMWRSKSAGDLSLPWLILYSFGLMLSNAYLIYIEAMAAWIPMCVELALTLATLALKLYLDAAYPEQPDPLGQNMGQEASMASIVSSPRSEASSKVPVYGRAVSRRAADSIAELAHQSTCPHCHKQLNVRLKKTGSGRWSGTAIEIPDANSIDVSNRYLVRDPDATV